MPVGWSLGAVAYALVSRRLPAPRRLHLGLLLVALITGLNIWLRMHYPTFWSLEQWSNATGADQAFPFDHKYFLTYAGMLFAWVTLALERLRAESLREALRHNLPLQLSLLTVATIVLIPAGIQLPGFTRALEFIPDRMSLALAVCLCAWLATVHPRKEHIIFSTGAAALYFAMLYHDGAALNRLEDQIERTVAQLPRGAKVVAPIELVGSRIPAAGHLLDRACIQRCFAYANYEPTSLQFRVRATGANRYVTAYWGDAFLMQMGTYVVKPEDTPLYQVMPRSGAVEAIALKAGDRVTRPRITIF